MPRERLPNRRPSMTATAAWPLTGANAVHVSVGVDSAGKVREVFARAARADSELDLVADDAGVLLSLLLQNGATLAAIVHSMGRSSEGAPASVIALVADVALRIEADLQGPRLVDPAGASP